MSLNKKLEHVAKNIGSAFTFKGRVLSPAEIFADTGLLPGLAKRADQLAQLCFGYGIGVTFEDVEDAILGIKANFDEFTPDVLRLFVILDTLYEMVRSSGTPEAVSLDELLYD